MFDIDSVMQKVFVPKQTVQMSSAKRYFSERKNNQKNNKKIQISRKMLKCDSKVPSPIISHNEKITDKPVWEKPVILIDSTIGPNEESGCLSPMIGNSQVYFDAKSNHASPKTSKLI